MSESPLPLFEAVRARDAALKTVAENSGTFIERAMDIIASMSGEVTGEDVRFKCEAEGCTPHHHNAWGAVISQAVRRGHLVPTDRLAKMRGPKSHARRTMVYRCR